MLINTLLHGLYQKTTLAFGIPSIIFGFVAGNWLAFLTPVVLMIGGSMKYYFEIKKLKVEAKKEKAELYLAELETEKIEQENELRAIEIERSKEL